MRMWKVDTRFMCNKHLLGEHVELHMFVGALQKGKNLLGYVRNGLVDLADLSARHNELVVEMLHRGMKHNSPLSADYELPGYHDWGHVDTDRSMRELFDRCLDCNNRYG